MDGKAAAKSANISCEACRLKRRAIHANLRLAICRRALIIETVATPRCSIACQPSPIQKPKAGAATTVRIVATSTKRVMCAPPRYSTPLSISQTIRLHKHRKGHRPFLPPINVAYAMRLVALPQWCPHPPLCQGALMAPACLLMSLCEGRLMTVGFGSKKGKIDCDRSGGDGGAREHGDKRFYK